MGKAKRIKLKDVHISHDRYGLTLIEVDYGGYTLHKEEYMETPNKHEARAMIEKSYASQLPELSRSL